MPTEGFWDVVSNLTAPQGTPGPALESRLFQDVSLPATVTSMTFDLQAFWNLAGATAPQFFDVIIEPAGGGIPLQTTNILNLIPGTNGSVAPPVQMPVNLAPFAGTNVRVIFSFRVNPELTPPPTTTIFIDNVSILCQFIG